MLPADALVAAYNRCQGYEDIIKKIDEGFPEHIKKERREHNYAELLACLETDKAIKKY